MTQDSVVTTAAEANRRLRRERFEVLQALQQAEGISAAEWARRARLAQSGVVQYGTDYATPSDTALAELAAALGLPREASQDIVTLMQISAARWGLIEQAKILHLVREGLLCAAEIFDHAATENTLPDMNTIGDLLAASKDSLNTFLASFEQDGNATVPETARMRQQRADLTQFQEAALSLWRAIYKADRDDGRTLTERLSAWMKAISVTHYREVKILLGGTDAPRASETLMVGFLFHQMGQPPVAEESHAS